MTRESQGLVEEVLTHSDAVVVEEPADLRAEVVRRLRAVVGEDA